MNASAVDWANMTDVGAFIGGVVLGSAMTIRVMRYVLDYRKHRDS